MDSPIDKPKDYPSDTQLEEAIEAGKGLSGTPNGERTVFINLVITDGKGAGTSERFSADLGDKEAVDEVLSKVRLAIIKADDAG